MPSWWFMISANNKNDNFVCAFHFVHSRTFIVVYFFFPSRVTKTFQSLWWFIAKIEWTTELNKTAQKIFQLHLHSKWFILFDWVLKIVFHCVNFKVNYIYVAHFWGANFLRSLKIESNWIMCVWMFVCACDSIIHSHWALFFYTREIGSAFQLLFGNCLTLENCLIVFSFFACISCHKGRLNNIH